MRVILFFLLLALRAGAAWLPHSSHDEGQLALSIEISQPVWNCSVRTWVRAPDLTPNMRTRADARVVVEGSDCKDIKRMDVGLRMAERSVYKFRAPGVELPQRPVMDYSSTIPFHQNASIFKVDAFGPGSWGQSPEQQAFEFKQAEYAKAMEDPALWLAAGVERNVFDSTTLLKTFKAGLDIERETIVSFDVVVPNTNFPPVKRNVDYYGSETEVASHESLFEYYIAVQLSNGSVISYPSGRSGFLPLASQDVTKTSLTTVHLPLHNPRVNTSNSRSSQAGFKRRNGRHLEYSPWNSEQKAPDCDEGNLAEFVVDVQMLENAAFTPGQLMRLNTTITRRGNGTQVPTHIAFLPMSCQTNHWAAQHAHTEDLKDLTQRCSRPSMYDPNDTSDMLALSPFNETRYVEGLERRRRECSGDGRGMFSTTMYRDWDSGSNPTKLDPVLERQSVLVNFTVPLGAMPDFEATFIRFKNQMQIALRTEFTCENGTRSGPFSNPVEDSSDMLWEPIRYQHYGCPQEAVKRTTHRLATDMPIVIRPASTGDAQSYRDASALAPALVPHGYSEPIKFPSVSARLVAETAADQLVQTRYASWLRMPPRPCVQSSHSDSDDMLCGMTGGEHSHAAEAWRHMQMRDDLKRIQQQLEARWTSGGDA